MRIYVGNLPYRSTENELREIFAEHGEVISASIVMDRETGRSRGFGFVTFEDNDAADAAIARMDGADLDGRNIRVNEARDRGGRGGGGGHRGGGGGRGGGRGGYGGGGDRGGYGGGGGGGYGGGGGRNRW